jgi:pimeloyl-ACP methyl ester carboxylesterase
MRRVFGLGMSVGLLLAAGAFIAGWYYAGEIEREALATPRPPPAFDLLVAGLADGEITLRPTAAADRDHGDWQKAGWFGIAATGGAGTVGDITRRDGDDVTRELIAFNSSIAVGDQARLRALSYSGDPLGVHAVPFDEIIFESDVGRLGAWFVAGSSDTWAIVVHGRAADRSESLEVLPTLVALGIPTLAIQYRNDAGVAASASGFYDFGLSEWRDLEASARYAFDHGAEDVVLIGYSMGGSIILSFLYRSDLANRVRGIVLDSPVLDFGDVIDFAGEQRGLWWVLTALGKAAAAVRSNLSWRDLDYLDRVDELTVPILLFHGDGDRIVNIRQSDTLAAARPDLVTYVRFDAVGHVRGWNMQRDAYEKALADFLIAVEANASADPLTPPAR